MPQWRTTLWGARGGRPALEQGLVDVGLDVVSPPSVAEAYGDQGSRPSSRSWAADDWSDDPRYHAVVDKRFNKRFTASPDYVRLVRSADEVVSAVQDAVSEGRRLVVTSRPPPRGFVSDPDVR
jgi:hypothetical protein